MRLTEHFGLEEMTKTDTGLDNDPPIECAADLIRLCEDILEPIRALLGNQPIKINSGYRSKWVNRQVGGVINSQHTKGQAADFVPQSVSLKVAYDLIRESSIPYDQLILEPTWLHVSIASEGEPPRRQAFAKEK